MYAYVKGILAASYPIYVIVECKGIGYKLYVPANALEKLPPPGSEVLLHTSFIVRELSHTLYGFPCPQERDMFESLLNVSGIGPKIALSIIGHLPLAELQQAIARGNYPTILRIPGIGKKSAERLVMEMRDKIPGILHKEFSELSVHFTNDPQSQKIHDAMSALINLGYTQAAAQKALKKTLGENQESINLGELITSTLKNL